MKKGMRLVGFVLTLSTMLVLGLFSGFPAEAQEMFRRGNFGNEFRLTTPEGVNARGVATAVSTGVGSHLVNIRVNGLTPGAPFVVINHFFEPIPERGIGSSEPADDPACTGHFQFLGSEEFVDKNGELNIDVRVGQLAPHIWVVNFNKFLEVTADGTQAPSSPDAFVIGGLLIPFEDLLAEEGAFVDTDALTDCAAKPTKPKK